MKLWNAVVALALVLWCGINLLGVARRMPPQPRAPAAMPRDLVLRHEHRFASVRAALQRHEIRGPLGYLADVPAAELAGNHQQMEQYFLTQFALAPWVFDAKPEDWPWVIANLHRTSLADRIPAGFRVVEEFGAGVALLQKTRP